jgi:hypothetical protein
MGKLITFASFCQSTKGVFKITSLIPRRTPDYTSKSGSLYWFGGSLSDSVLASLKLAKTDSDWLKIYQTLRKEEKRSLYVIRLSNHWSSKEDTQISSRHHSDNNKINTCKWFLKIPNNNQNDLESTDTLCGIAKLSDFVGRVPSFKRK